MFSLLQKSWRQLADFSQHGWITSDPKANQGSNSRAGCPELLSLLIWSVPGRCLLWTGWEDGKQTGNGLVFTEPACLLADANTVLGQLGSVLFPFCLHVEAGAVFVWGADGVLLVVSVCQLLLIDVIVPFLIFTLGFNMEVTLQIILEQS